MPCVRRSLRTRFGSTGLGVLLAATAVLVACGGDGGGGSVDTGGNGSSPATPGIALVAGALGGPGNLDGVGPEARLEQARSIAVDAAGNIYAAGDVSVPPSPVTRLRKVTPAGVVTTLVGQAATDAMPDVRVRDALGNIYAADTNSHTITRTTGSGLTTIFAGAAGVIGSADGAGTLARFNRPSGVVLDANGNLYVADDGNNTIRKITPAGAVTTFAGSAGVTATVNGTGQDARFTGVGAIVIDRAGSLYVTGFDYVVRKVTNDGTASTLAGAPGLRGIDDGTGASAHFNSNFLPLAIDADGNLYTSDNTTIRRITPAGTVLTLAGARRHFGQVNGTGAAARFGGEFASLAAVVARDALGNIYVQEAREIRKVTPEGSVSTLVAHGANQILAFATDASGNLYAQCPVTPDPVRFVPPNSVCKITPAGAMTPLPGTAGLHALALAMIPQGDIYAIDLDNRSARRFTQTGQSSTLLTADNLPGSGNNCGNFDNIAADSEGNVFVSNNQQVLRTAADGTARLLAGWADGPCFFVGQTNDNSAMRDGLGAAARFVAIRAMTTDTQGNLYVIDNNTIRKISPNGLVSTIVGQPDSWGVRLGPLPGSLHSPNGLVAMAGEGSPRLATMDENAVILITLP